MTPDDVFALLLIATALRVFAPDFRQLLRHLLRAGVRVGVAALLDDRTRDARQAEARVPLGQDEEAHS
ncbi:hypothetical protein [Streptomyces tsukubensis]|uniref:Uncharacterized protein n=1 Tax=Streptomyces tsukubensis TaxID=83656 RepID=A0A1V4AAB7_9ACTN|nr:hypothetical protein [Streptomyces tsukubensis]OON80050.1 hypothetical protein B1H18_12790 [Streptomyces tsukubensis]QFR97284.1 hypothetical protein GBW32_34755 [Streptomyces tsukubensis]